MIVCDKCKIKINHDIKHDDGLPMGVGFQLEDGTIINLCANCIKSLGEMTEQQQAQFFEKLKM